MSLETVDSQETSQESNLAATPATNETAQRVRQLAAAHAMGLHLPRAGCASSQAPSASARHLPRACYASSHAPSASALQPSRSVSPAARAIRPQMTASLANDHAQGRIRNGEPISASDAAFTAEASVRSRATTAEAPSLPSISDVPKSPTASPPRASSPAQGAGIDQKLPSSVSPALQFEVGHLQPCLVRTYASMLPLLLHVTAILLPESNLFI